MTHALPDGAGALVVSSAKAILASTIRTVTPILVGLLITGFSKIHVDLDSGTAETLVTALISSGISVGYYVLARLLEVFQNSKFGWLLGYAAAAPVYLTPAKAANVAQPDAANE